MSQFELVTVAISMIMALGVARLLDVVAPALRAPQRSWIHVGWVLQKLLNHFFWWWTLWLARDLDWNLGLFMFELLGSIILYLQATALASAPEDPASGWESRFFEIRVPFFLGNLGLCFLSFAYSIYYDVPNQALFPIALIAMLAIAGLITRSTLAHKIIVSAALLLQVGGIGRATFGLIST